MTGLPRFAPKSIHAVALTAALAGFLLAGIARAQQEAAPGAASEPTTTPSVPADLKSAADDFWHYGRVGRYDLAVAEGQKLLSSGAEPQVILSALETAAADHKDQLDGRLLYFQGIEPMKDVTAQVIKVVSDGYVARRSDPKYIQEHISRLTVNERAYGLAMSRLRESGELAVPFMLNVVRDPAKRQSLPTMRRALRDMGRYALNPLVAATETKDWDTLVTIVLTLGDLGYDAAAPYVARVFESPEAPAAVKAASAEALAKLGAVRNRGAAASDLFFLLAEKFYNDESSITADSRFPTANIWYWNADSQMLERKQVPHQIYNDLMAERACEYSLKLGGAHSDDAMSLWLAANYRREADLPQGAADATRPEGYPPAHYWGVQAGSKYLNAALARALKDHNSAVAFRAIRSLQEIVGQSNLFEGQSSRPLIDALQYPDRKVRFEAALALAGALPQTRFEGQQRVIPLLAEAISQTGQPSVLVVMPSKDAVNKMVEDLKGLGYAATGANTAEAAISLAATLPAVDVILVSEEMSPGSVDQLFNMASQNARLAGAARLIMTKTNASLYEARKVNEPLLATTTATDAAGLKPAIDDARNKAGALPLDPDIATQYATRAGEMMIKVGISRGQIYDLSPAKQSLLASLSDTRPEIVKLAGQVLALVNAPDAQAGLLVTASDEKTADDVKISLYKSLATSAKFFGSKLDASQVQMLEKTVADATNLDVRSAAAEARGALNLPADQAKNLIVKQSRT